jgi:hypothetical protein
MTDMSFQEKSVWGSLIALAGCSIYYFARVLGMYREGSTVDPSGAGALGISLLVALIVIEIVYHSVLAATAGSTESDERDRWIETRASRNAYVALGIGAFGVAVHLFGASYFESPRYADFVTPFAVANIVLFAIASAEVVKYISQIVYYRTGAS